MSCQVLLSRVGLEDYYIYFDNAGKTMFDGSAHPSNFAVEQIIVDVERANGIMFAPEIRVTLWKAIRHQWFRSRQAARFVERSQVPNMALPKRDYTQVDSMVPMKDIDPDRQRQIMRKTRLTNQAAFRGPAKMTLQFEVYRRQSDLAYEFRDLTRCVDEWQMRNPRGMQRQDTREEVLKQRIRALMDAASIKVGGRRKTSSMQFRLMLVMLFMKSVLGCMSLLMFFIAQYRYRNLPQTLFLSFFASSNQFISGVAFFIAYMFAFAIEKRWHEDPSAAKLQRMIYSCERLNQQISDFRGETEEYRMEQTPDPSLGILQRRGKKKLEEESKAAEAKAAEAIQMKSEEGIVSRKSRNKHEDSTIGIWTKNGQALDFTREPEPGEDGPIEIVQKAIAESFERLPPLAKGFKRAGGDRMINHAHRLGGVADEDLVVPSRRPPKKLPPLLEVTSSLPELPAAPGLGLAVLVDLPAPPPPLLPPPPSSTDSGSAAAAAAADEHTVDGLSPIGGAAPTPLLPPGGQLQEARAVDDKPPEAPPEAPKDPAPGEGEHPFGAG